MAAPAAAAGAALLARAATESTGAPLSALRRVIANAAAARRWQHTEPSARASHAPPVTPDNAGAKVTQGRSSETVAVAPLQDPRLQGIVDDVFAVRVCGLCAAEALLQCCFDVSCFHPVRYEPLPGPAVLTNPSAESHPSASIQNRTAV